MLPSPIIEGTLPAFYYSEIENGAVLTVPFSMSRSVHSSEVEGFCLKIKNIQGGDVLLTLEAKKEDINFADYQVKFKINKEVLDSKKFIVGNFYKAQLAYCYKEKNQSTLSVGYFSTVGIIKYTTKPKISILGLDTSFNNVHSYSYTGEYSQLNQDFTEKEYSYRFVVKNSKGLVIEDTGYLIHNSSEDTEYYQSRDNFLFSQDLDENEKYTIVYSVKTNNGLEESSPVYWIFAQKSVISTMNAKLVTTLNYNNGYVQLSLIGEKDQFGYEKSVCGSFILSRASEKTNYTQWEEINRFVLVFEKPSSKTWKDFTIEQGTNYKYSIQQYNTENLFSERIISVVNVGSNSLAPIYKENPIFADFEDSFLFDGQRQLKIKFNPKVASFKKDLFEAKVDTIGSKYPFIFKNGKVEYREFPIGGLISYLMDEESLFNDTNSIFFSQERKYRDSFIKVDFPKYGQENAYKKNHLFYYFKDKETNQYVRWIEYIRKQVDSKVENPTDKDYDWSNWNKWWIQFKAIENDLYFHKKEQINHFDPDKNLVKTLNETSTNISIERNFKLDVLEWLTNGKPKLFKSPNEGNYLVRLMNVSLTPNDQVGRMLHSFTCTAYEIDDLTYDSLVENGIISITDLSKNKYLKIITIPLSTTDENYVKLNTHIDYQRDENGIYYAQGQIFDIDQTAEWVDIVDMRPGDKIILNEGEKNDSAEILIGSTGSYSVPIPTKSLTIPKDLKSHGLVTFGYYGELNDSFSQITGTNIREVIGQQFIGKFLDIVHMLENTARKIITFYDIKIHKRPLIELTINDSEEAYDNGILIGSLQDHDNFIFQLPKYANPLNTYQYRKQTSDLLNSALYCQVKFEETEKMDNSVTPPNRYQNEDIHYAYESQRYINVRTVTNQYLLNIRDFEPYINSGKLYVYEEKEFKQCKDLTYDPSKKYFIQEDIEFIVVPESKQKYLSNHSYTKFLEMYTLTSQSADSFKLLFQPFKYIAKIDGKEISVKETLSYETGGIGKIHTLESFAGVYCELFYQAQIINYNISKSALVQEKKAIVDMYEKKLQKEYMIQQCQDSENIPNFIAELEDVYRNYDFAYEQYIAALDNYLIALEKEG